MTLSQAPDPNQQKDPAQRDAERLKHHYPLSFLIKLLALLLMLFLIICIAFYIMAGTERGTKFILEKIVSETGVKLKYQEGNLLDGVKIKDITMSASKDVDVHFLNTFVKVGWRALFARQVHLRDADIETIVIENRMPPSGDPFKYKKYELPVDLRFDKAHINKIIYNQAQRDPIEVTNISAIDLYWIGTKVNVGRGNLQYSDIVKIADLNGSVTLEGNYPLDLSAVATVNKLQKVYVDPIEIKAKGSVKRTYGEIHSKYNNNNVDGVFTVQGLDDNAPFEAKLNWDKIDLPYAEGQQIRLTNGMATASGVISDIDLRINSDLVAKDIPSGHYQARADIIDTKKMLIQQLTATTPEGNLLARGVLDWDKVFTAKAMLYSKDYKVRGLLPKNAAPYAPEYLDGELAVVYQLRNKDNLMQINSNLQQRDGEQIKAKVVQGAKPKNPRFKSPWYVDASWKNLRRNNVPQVGDIDSPSGVADVTLRDERLWVTANAEINKLNIAPAGDYQVKLNKYGNKIDLQYLNYDGVIGDLAGKGSILLATKNSPLTWSIDAKTKELRPQVFNDSIPVNRLEGNINATGKMIDVSRRINGKLIKGQRHVLTINSTDLSSILTTKVNSTNPKTGKKSSENRYVDIKGRGDGVVDVLNGSLQNFDARFNGKVATQGVPKGIFIVDANGTTKNINIRNFKHTGEAGDVTASGNVNLIDGINWNIKANTNRFNIGFFAPQTSGIITGDLQTSGKWRDNKTKLGDLRDFNVKFNGSIDTPQLPKGKLIIDAGGDAHSINIRNLSHVGEAGSIIAKGKVDVRDGIAWDINAVMDDFNLSYFVKDVPSNITGKLSSTGLWKDSIQRITLDNMALRGEIDGQPLLAQGSLKTTLHLPKNMNQYFAVLKSNDTNGKVQNVKSVVETLNANNLLLKWGDNQVVANGNAEHLEAKVGIQDLRQINKNFSGSVLGGFTLIQDKGQALPTIYVDLTGDKLALPGFLLDKGVIKGKIVDLAKRPSTLVVMANGLQASGSKFENIYAVFNGTEQDHTLTLKGDTTNANNEVGLQATIKGTLDRKNNTWRGVVGDGQISTKFATLAQSQPAQLIVSYGGKTPEVQLAAHCWEAIDQTGKICLRENLIASTTKGQVNLAIQQIDTSLFAPFMPKDLSWQASLNGKAVVEWGKGIKPVINATLYSDNGKFGMIQEGQDKPITVGYKRISVIARSFEEGLKLRTDIDNGNGAKGYADVVIDPYKENKPLSGALVLNELNLAILKPFFPGMRRLEGNITMAGGLGGTLKSPVFYGDVNLRNATVAMLDLPINLTDINAKAKIRGQKASLEGTFLSGEGKGELSGTIDWQQELQAKLRVTGERLVLTQPPLLYAEVNPDLNIIVKPLQQYVNIVGAVSVPTATIRPPEANEKVVTKSDDVVVLNRALIGNIEEVLAISKPWSINADIGVDLGKDVYFRGFGAVLPLAGAIHVTQKGQGVMNALGVVQVSRRSTIDAFGQNLELNYAQVRFNGDVTNPRVSIEADKEIEGRTVGVRVKGRVSEPNIVVFNDAGLTQQQAMNALVTGRISNSGATQISEEGFKSEVTNNLAAAGLSLGLTGTRGLTNSIGNAFGLERLTIDASGTDSDTNVNVTGYITPDLYIRYGVGVFNSQSTLSLRYQLTHRIYIEATSAAENAVDVVYSFNF
ncbi:translocation/assembly module TamB domain-containing protein [Psychrobacter sp.]|uniref:translocation/assembly module TamB domain-containing protein n=1 Tax=Psychrobacter sp. TaxID=56811 RepID=UPI0025FB4D60|nr:translocation/assembly module TamB domain-containing protein [Psychrobacter sp.]